MKDKFTYFDFLAYFIPGAVILWICSVMAKDLGVLSALETGNVFTESLAFIVLAFVVGHFVQFRSKQKTEATIKEKYWSNAFVSEAFLLRDNEFCSEFKRRRYINLLQKHFGLAEESVNTLVDHESEEARVISHGMYRECFTFITDKGLGQKATKANEYYNFFRGLSTTCVYSIIVSVLDFVYLSIRFFTHRTFVGLAHSLTMLVLTIFFGYAVYAFRIRAKQRGELHVAEVFDSIAGYFAEKSS